MRNVYKGFKFSTRAVPHTDAARINKEYAKAHGPSLRRPALRMSDRVILPHFPKAPGRYPKGKR